MRVIISNIDWDIDEDDSPNLPTSEVYDLDDDTEEDEIEDLVSDKLSDDYGYCHNGFSYLVYRPNVLRAGDT